MEIQALCHILLKAFDVSGITVKVSRKCLRTKNQESEKRERQAEVFLMKAILVMKYKLEKKRCLQIFLLRTHSKLWKEHRLKQYSKG